MQDKQCSWDTDIRQVLEFVGPYVSTTPCPTVGPQQCKVLSDDDLRKRWTCKLQVAMENRFWGKKKFCPLERKSTARNCVSDFQPQMIGMIASHHKREIK